MAPPPRESSVSLSWWRLDLPECSWRLGWGGRGNQASAGPLPRLERLWPHGLGPRGRLQVLDELPFPEHQFLAVSVGGVEPSAPQRSGRTQILIPGRTASRSVRGVTWAGRFAFLCLSFLI